MKTLMLHIGLLASLLTGHQVEIGQYRAPAQALPAIEFLGQTGHALELFRKSGYSYALTDARIDMRPYVIAAVEASLPHRFHDRALTIAQSVITEGNRYNMDPFFLLAVMKTESRFNLNAVGMHGEIGLMQIRPSTAAWLAPQVGLPRAVDLHDPTMNIRIGALYLAQLRKSFQYEPQRYVGAYNMGATNVRRLLASKNIEPHIYPGKVMGNYRRFYRALSLAVRTSPERMNVAFQTE